MVDKFREELDNCNQVEVMSPSIRDVKQLVIPEGPCIGLRSIKSKAEGRVKDIVHFEREDAQVDQLIMQAEEKAVPLKQIFAQVLDNDRLIYALARKTQEEEITRDELREMLGISDESLLERIYFILNYNLDPEFLPLFFKLEHPYMHHKILFLFQNLLERSVRVRAALVSLFANPDFRKEYYSAGNGKPYSEQIMREISQVIETILLEGRTLCIMTDDYSYYGVRDFLKRFLNVGRYYPPYDSEVADIRKFQNLIAEIYFDFDWISGKNGWSLEKSNFFNPNIRRLLTDYAVAVEKGKYLVSLYRRIEELYGRFFPEVYLFTDEQGLGIDDPTPISRKEKVIEGYQEVNGWYNPRLRQIGVKSGTIIKALGKEAFVEETFHFGGPKGKRRVIDAITMWHEKTHAIYHARKPIDESFVLKEEEYYKTVDSAINEGFAVFMELVFIRFMKANPQFLGFDASDIAVLDLCKKARLNLLKAEENAYTEGIYKLINRIYGSAYGNSSRQDVVEGAQGIHRGIRAVMEFIDSLDRKKALETLRTDKVYQAVIKRGNPEELKKYFRVEDT